MGFWGAILLVFLILTFKGSSGEGQPTLFGNLIKEYIEETAVSLADYTEPAEQLADISTIAVANSNSPGQGGPDALNTPSPINENSLLAHNPTNTDYMEAVGSRRSQITEYTVQTGDLLSFIAADYGVSMDTIIWANQLKNANSISPGQILKIPPVSGIIHEVKKGDTVASIAKKYSAEQDKIIEYNGLPQSGELTQGDDIIVPDGKMKSTSVAVKSGSSAAAAKPFAYLPNLGDYFMLPTLGYNWGRIHGRNGVDIASSCGTPVYAAADGTVATADGSGYNGGFGKYIKIAHPNGTETLYGHSMKLLVSVGQNVSRGEEIMLMGTTGRSTGCHLHFEVHGARNPLAKY